MDWVERTVAGLLVAALGVLAGLVIYLAVTPSDPNAKVCPVVGNVAICEK